MKTHWFRVAALAAGTTFALPAFSAEVDQRLHNQRERIEQGVESGKLRPAQAARLERQDNRIRREVNAERAANGGVLTPGERRQVNRQENRTSRAIYRAKH